VLLATRLVCGDVGAVTALGCNKVLTSQSMSSRASDALSNIPVATFSTLVLCCLVFLLQLLVDPPLHHYTLCPRDVVHLNEYYRFLTSAVFHGGVMHLFFNMMSTVAIGSLLEKRSGTFRHTITILWGILLTSATYTACAVLLHVTVSIESLMYRHSIGFSGVIFHLSVLEANLSPNVTRSVFGFFRVPSYLYPWALLVALQFILPNVSFVGHLSGILVGTLQLYGFLDIIMPSDGYLREMEDWRSLQFITCLASFVKTPEQSDVSIHSRNPGELREALLRSFRTLWKFLGDILETLKVILFGRGRPNANIHVLSTIDDSTQRNTRLAAAPNFSDDDDWAGLPPPPSPDDVESATV